MDVRITRRAPCLFGSSRRPLEYERTTVYNYEDFITRTPTGTNTSCIPTFTGYIINSIGRGESQVSVSSLFGL